MEMAYNSNFGAKNTQTACVAHKCTCICERRRLWQSVPAKPDTLLLMNKKTFGLSFLLSTLVLSSAFGQNASPSANPKAASPSPSLQSTVAAPVVKIRIVVRSDEAAIRALVENSLRTELGKLKHVAELLDPGASSPIFGGKLGPVTGLPAKRPVYTLGLSILEPTAIYNTLVTGGVSRHL